MTVIKRKFGIVWFWKVYDHDGTFLGLFDMPKKPEVNEHYAGGVIEQVYQESFDTFRLYLKEPRKV